MPGLPLDFPDLTVTPDQRSSTDVQIAFRVRKDEDQEHPTSEASTSSVVIGGTGYKDKPMGGYS